MTPALTLFATCKPFLDHFGIIQRNALRSWKSFCPPCEVIVFGDETGVRESCEELGFRQVPKVNRTALRTPLLSDLFQQASALAAHDYLAYVNADIMLTSDLMAATAISANKFEEFLLIARRWNVEVKTEWDFQRADWEVELRRYAKTYGTVEPPYGGVDVFVFPRRMWNRLPAYAVGRTRWDSALIYEARKRRIPVIDATSNVTSIHQNHDYSHITSGAAGVLKGDEAVNNQRLLGGEEFVFTPLNATHVLTNSDIRLNRVFYPPHLLRKLAVVPALHRSLRPLAPAVRALAPWWRRIKKTPKTISVDSNGNRLPPKSAYPISIKREAFYPAAIPRGGGVENFDTPESLALNKARMAHLDSLKLPCAGKSVLDVGSGVGHLAQFFIERGSDVLCLEGRQENVVRLKVLYPHLQVKVFDVERDSLSLLGSFDIIFAFEILYQLENPFRALRRLAAVCKELLLIETMVADHHLPLVRMSEETSLYNQALHNIGSRSTPSFVVLALRNSGFQYVYTPTIPINHPDFQFDWRDDLSDSRDDHLLRCMFIASRSPMNNPHLTTLL